MRTDQLVTLQLNFILIFFGQTGLVIDKVQRP